MPQSTVFAHGSDGMATSANEAAHRRQAVMQRHKIRIVGEGKPTMLLCNGFGCNQQIWRHMTPALATRFQLVLFDHAGVDDWGATQEAFGYTSLARYAQDIVEICQVLGLQQVTVVGHSVGGMIALLAANQAPEYFAHLILLATSPHYLNEPGYFGGFEREDIQQLLELMEADYDSWANLFANLLMGPTNSASLSQEMAGYFCQTNSEAAKQFARVAFLADNRADIARLQVPALILQCSQDVVAPTEVGDYMQQHIPHATLHTLQAMGHCPHLSAPLETLTAIESYLGHRE